ncbi:CGNR zinc finger domain-containing protein [Mycolicibacterium smegmatis]|uniref:CGNR zinc finger domain-containing protein n=1 Tax=Mycolicibacterium smegmatis TaxID=1772 RepID=UPI001EFB15DD|nr:ABATE domain-containing protein [Mycolicibacterium smegmatis]ULN32850.1 ABATE domain-containing protein [Mycolicibacterium smegmatis]
MTVAAPAPRVDEPAPLALANTLWIDRHGVHDALADKDYVQAWIRAVGKRLDVRPAPGSTDGLRLEAVGRLIEVRDAFRRLAAEATGDSRDLVASPVPDVATAVSLINAASAAETVWPELRFQRRSGLTRQDAWSGDAFAEAVITVIARQAIELATSPRWEMLRACEAPACAYFFIKEHRREWCSALCGNRARVARHAQRQHNR